MANPTPYLPTRQQSWFYWLILSAPVLAFARLFASVWIYQNRLLERDLEAIFGVYDPS